MGINLIKSYFFFFFDLHEIYKVACMVYNKMQLINFCPIFSSGDKDEVLSVDVGSNAKVVNKYSYFFLSSDYLCNQFPHHSQLRISHSGCIQFEISTCMYII